MAVLGALAVAGCGASTRDPVASPEAEDRRAAMPRSAVDDVHRTLHRLPRTCSPQRVDRRRLDMTTSRFLDLYRRFPADRYEFQIDDEAGTMLSALLVLRDELSRCSPRHAARIDPVLPASIRRALRPLRTGSG